MDNNDQWKAAHEAAWKVNVEAMQIAESGKEVPMKMRLLANYEHQFQLAEWTRKFGLQFAERRFEQVVKQKQNQKLYEEFCDRQRKAGMPEGDIIGLPMFILHIARAMEYAEFCEKMFEEYGPAFIEACGGMPCSYRQFDISRCREIASGGK